MNTSMANSRFMKMPARRMTERFQKGSERYCWRYSDS